MNWAGEVRRTVVNRLHYLERPFVGEPEGLLILHHGRGMDEGSLLGVAHALDPEGRLRVVAPRGPVVLPDSDGYHWYHFSMETRKPVPESFHGACQSLADLHDDLWAETGIGPERTVLAGFSMGAAIAYAMALDVERPPVAGMLAFSGKLHEVEGWEPSPGDRSTTRVMIVHGRDDTTVPVADARATRDLLLAAGFEVEYMEVDSGHRIDRRSLPHVKDWLSATLGT
jgi:phospholipase/carboxylesterase